MRIATANVMALPKMPPEQVHHDVTNVASRSGVVGWQEIHPDYYVAELKALAGWDHYGLNRLGGAPISWRTASWRFIEGDSVLLHDSTPGVCAERRLNWVLLERQSRLPWRRQRVYFTNRHYVARAWTHDDPDDDLRKAMWIEANKTDRNLCTVLNSKGHPVVGLGDYNRPSASVMGRTLNGRKVQYLVHRGIDYVWVVNGRTRRWKSDGVPVRLDGNSDHAARIVNGQFR